MSTKPFDIIDGLDMTLVEAVKLVTILNDLRILTTQPGGQKTEWKERELITAQRLFSVMVEKVDLLDAYTNKLGLLLEDIDPVKEG